MPAQKISIRHKKSPGKYAVVYDELIKGVFNNTYFVVSKKGVIMPLEEVIENFSFPKHSAIATLMKWANFSLYEKMECYEA